jgi:hypothetical protein
MSQAWTDTRAHESLSCDAVPGSPRDRGNDLVDCLTGGTAIIGTIAAIAFTFAGVLFLFAKFHGFFRLAWLFAGIALIPFLSIEMLMLFRWWGVLALLAAACAVVGAI